jgi:hypothetical protein
MNKFLSDLLGVPTVKVDETDFETMSTQGLVDWMTRQTNPRPGIHGRLLISLCKRILALEDAGMTKTQAINRLAARISTLEGR